MNFALFYSHASPFSIKLLQELPSLKLCGVNVDTAEGRNYARMQSIKSVPTLAILIRGQVVDLVHGEPEIKQWFLDTTTLLDRLLSPPELDSLPRMDQPAVNGNVNAPRTAVSTLMPPMPENVPTGAIRKGDVKSIADQLSKERDAQMSEK